MRLLSLVCGVSHEQQPCFMLRVDSNLWGCATDNSLEQSWAQQIKRRAAPLLQCSSVVGAKDENGNQAVGKYILR